MRLYIRAFLFSLCSFFIAGATHAATVESTQSGAWSNPQMWSTHAVPMAGDSVTVNNKHTVTYDVNSTDLISLLRVNGTLAFANNKNTLLTVNDMQVYGTFQIGEKKNPLPRQYTARVQLDGEMRSLMTFSGNMEIHGAKVNRTWTRLAETVRPGATSIMLKKKTTWKPGNEIVIASTSYKPEEAERRTIASVSEDGKTITLTQPLQYLHYGEGMQFAEVGLLSHNIQFRGKNEDMHGHIMFMGTGGIHIEHASFEQLGNYGVLAQYPLHFHMMGDQYGSYIKSVGIADTGNRCITVHGTNGVVVKNNVAYNAQGHCYFMEDGVEQNNKFIHNLGMLTRPGATLPSDKQPATFWVTNPNNTYDSNAAGGSSAFGFWFFFQDKPTGLSADQPMTPNRLPIQKFKKNVSHSNLSHGFTLDGHGFGAVSFTPPQTAKFTKLKAYKNVNNGLWMRGRGMEFSGITVMDNRIGIAFPANNVMLKNSTVIGSSSTPSYNTFPVVRGYDFYDGPNIIDNITFSGFTSTQKQNRAAIGLQPNNPFYMSKENGFSNVHFTDGTAFAFHDPKRNGEKFAVLYNANNNTSMLPLLPFHKSSGCTVNTQWNAYVCPGVRYGKLSYFNGTNTAAPTNFRVTRLDTNASLDLVPEGNSSNGRYFMNVPEGKEFKISAGNSHQMRVMYEGEEMITVRIPFARKPVRITEAEPYTYGQHPSYTDWRYDESRDEVILKMRGNKQYQFFTQ